jgi:alkylresorcinol/alkylpyrone synthase
MHKIVRGIGTAVPEHVVGQADVKDVVAALFSNAALDVDRLLSVFDHDHIQRRHFAMPLSWYAQEHTWPEQHAVWHAAALELAMRAAQAALDDAGWTAQEVESIVVATTTGFATPSLDAELLLQMGCRPSCARLPIVGLGCAAGVSGLRHAAQMQGKVLFVAVEVCSVTFQRNDLSKSNVVGTSLFADGAAAIAIESTAEQRSGDLVIREGYGVVFEDTSDIMGWDVADEGLRVRFRRDIPAFVHEHLGEVLDDACMQWGIDREAVRSYITHPGGAKVLAAFAQVCGLQLGDLQDSVDVLRMFGNMSSPTVLFVLQQARRRGMAAGVHVMSALGPGFSSELLLLEMVA